MACDGSPPRTRVLIAEDEALIVDFLALCVEDAGADLVGAAASAAGALALADASPVDLAIVDVMLSGPMDGIALAGELRARHRDIGVIFVSGSGDAETRARIAAARPIAFLQKPFRPSELQALIEARAARAGLA